MYVYIYSKYHENTDLQAISINTTLSFLVISYLSPALPLAIWKYPQFIIKICFFKIKRSNCTDKL